MSDIALKDNGDEQMRLPEEDRGNCDYIGGRTIGDLIRGNDTLLLFPPETKDRIESEHVFRVSHNAGVSRFVTGDIMGFVARGNTSWTICSRFAQGGAAGTDFFLHYMLQKVCHINFFDLPTGLTRERIFDFLPLLFPFYLKRALSQGLYKEYRRFEYDDARVRGVIDVSRHIRKNIPFCGKVAYKTREHSFDNAVTQLVRHTLEQLRGNRICRQLADRDPDVRAAAKQIIDATSDYNRFERDKVLARTRHPIRSPFFVNYEPLRKLCRWILMHEKLRYERSDKKIYGLLFDGAWLWEEYLWTLLKTCGNGITHTQNKEKSGGFSPFRAGNIGRFYPDFYGNGTVFDAKYKNFDKKNPDSADLQQMIAYMHVLDCGNGKFLFPSEKASSDEKRLGELNGQGGSIFTCALAIPQDAADYRDFCQKIVAEENRFVAFVTK
ncbi:MAG: McrC family protein [Opitutales bacterium]|nr:McrC family protein [Opitutales bacterium]